MKKILSWVLGAIIVAGVVYAARTTVDTNTDTFQTAWERTDDMFIELYGKWTSLGTTHDTSGELDALYEAELDNSAGLAAALSDKTGTGVAVFATSPTLVTPALGTIASGVGTALTALNGENVQNDTIDDDSIDWSDITLTDFTEQTAWRVFYSDTNGDVTELALGADGTYLKSNGADQAPTFATPAGSGDVSKVGTPADSEVGVWTGDGTIEGQNEATFKAQVNLEIGTDVQAQNAYLADIAGLTPAANNLIGWNAGATDLENKSQLTLQFVSDLEFEGSSADDHETTITVTNPTADRTVTLRDASGTVIISGDTFTGDVTGTLDTDGSTVLSLGADVVDEAHIADNGIDSEHYNDGSIDHEHLAADVISGMTEVTSADADYILVWDATDSALKRVDMGEVRGSGAETNSLEVLTTGIATTEIPIGTAADTVVYAALSGDITMDNTGATLIAADVVTAEKLDETSNFTGWTGNWAFDTGTLTASNGLILGGALTGIGQDLGSTASEFNDLFLNDGSIINFGNDQDVTLTHVADTGLTLNLDLTVAGGDLTLNAAGVKLTGDGDGALTILGLGDGADEDLTLNFDDTANTIVHSSSTGVTELNYSAIALVTTGDIMGGINVSSKAGAYTIGTDDASENFGTMFINSNVADLTLPGTTGVVGASGCLMQGAGVTGIMQLEPGTGSHLVYEGVEMTDGAPLASAGAATDRICWVCVSADHYIITSAIGTWGE